MHLWDRKIPQATLTLNLLLPSRINPRLSAKAQLNGPFNFNATPLAPPGTKVLIHETPDQQRSWAPHGVYDWYIGPELEHYRCYQVYVPTMRAECVAKTVQFFPNNCPVPKLSSADNAAGAARELTEALLNPTPAAPFATFGDKTMTAIRHLATIFAESSSSVSTPVPSTVSPPSAPRVFYPSPRVPPTPRVPTLPKTRAQVPQTILPDDSMEPEYHHGIFPQPFVPAPIFEPNFHALPVR